MATRKTNSSRAKSNKNSRSKKARMQEIQRKKEFQNEVIFLISIAVAVLLFISNFGIGGIVGNSFSGFFFGIFGLLEYVFPIFFIVIMYLALYKHQKQIPVLKIVTAILFLVALCIFTSLVYASTGNGTLNAIQSYKDAFSGKNRFQGGILGTSIANVLANWFGMIGAYIIDIILCIITVVLFTGKSAVHTVQKGSKKVYESARESSARKREYKEYLDQEHIKEENSEEIAPTGKPEKKRRMDKTVTGVSMDTRLVPDYPKNGSDEMGELHPDTFEQPDIVEEKIIPLSSTDSYSPNPQEAHYTRTDQIKISGNYVKDLAEEIIAQTPIEEPFAEQKAAVEPKTVRKNKPQPEKEEVEEIIPQQTAEQKVYELPPTSLLKAGSKKSSGNTENYLRDTANKLQQTLKNFGVNVTITDISCGPAVTRYELQPEMGVKVSKIVGLADDIKLNLAAADIRIEAPIPGKAAVGIEVPNKENVMVSFRDLIESPEFTQSKSKISFAVGKDIAGKTTVTDIAKMPHLLIAGATGSGKSVCINTIIMSILYKAHPDEVKLIMIDPKVVELSVYNGIPHLMIPVVTDPKKAAGALNWAVAEMTDRYNKFAEAGVREINGYNQKISESTNVDGIKLPKMPQIVIIVDELADLMMVASNDVEESICRLAQLARAAGIHLIIATQRPSVNVITGLIKANMPSRIAFAVTSGVDSRTILDMVGAEKLLGKGDMLFNPQGIPKPLRIQGAFVSDEEVQNVVSFLTQQNSQHSYSEDVQQKIEQIQASSGNTVSISDMDSNDDGRDALFIEAGRIITDKEKASIGMLQRYLKIGFNRAARIMDQLEEANVVGPEVGTKPRTVLMNTEEFNSFIDSNQ